VLTEDRLSLLFNKVVSCLIITCIEWISGLNLIDHYCADRGEVNTLHSFYFNLSFMHLVLENKIKTKLFQLIRLNLVFRI
jgi:hypothetical protein